MLHVRTKYQPLSCDRPRFFQICQKWAAISFWPNLYHESAIASATASVVMSRDRAEAQNNTSFSKTGRAVAQKRSAIDAGAEGPLAVFKNRHQGLEFDLKERIQATRV
jgi:hypothetical protein